jgi:hypothetical protein
MNRSNLYVPDPQTFIQYFKDKSKSQVGKGFYTPKTDVTNDTVSIKAVSPAEQTVNQAKSELKREDINSSEILSLLHNLSRQTSKRKSPKRQNKKEQNKKGGNKKGQNKKGGNKKGGNKKIKNKKGQKGVKKEQNRDLLKQFFKK